jgi:hypothetical protein
MSKREKTVIWSGGVLFLISYWLLSSIMEAASGVGDAPANMNIGFNTLIVSLSITAFYATVYYLVFLIIYLVHRK